MTWRGLFNCHRCGRCRRGTRVTILGYFVYQTSIHRIKFWCLFVIMHRHSIRPGSSITTVRLRESLFAALSAHHPLFLLLQWSPLFLYRQVNLLFLDRWCLIRHNSVPLHIVLNGLISHNLRCRFRSLLHSFNLCWIRTFLLFFEIVSG